ncbi:copper resistance system multicopper oxidase [Sphingobium sp.]|uniref:copper resistance system multicopper oxidase n=1 Tax=Sphingobium sp. TaxID=1912891 RepID=UPI000DB0D3C5|nr:copper resistance system multicopper oxidase [Sphingobium sp.]PZU64006.1 MAG: copper resistance system multicopper oxidase [Sphingobium sp.]
MLTDRRGLLRGAVLAGGGLAGSALLPAWAQSGTPGMSALSGENITLTIARQMIPIDGRESHAIGVNGTVPAPLLRLREGQKLRVIVRNELDEQSSIHWHGMLVPAAMDGVPGVSFPGIPARSAFVYDFPLIQSGTYWYHSHSGLQEQEGLYGPIVIDPAGPDRIAYDREHVIVLSDRSDVHPHLAYKHLKRQGGLFNYQKQTVAGLLRGQDQPLGERLRWGRMRMDPTDIADITGAAYHYLANGHGPADNWTAPFRPGERVRLRFINAATMTFFNVRIPGLAMTVVQADGQDVRPVAVDEFQMGNAETYDVIVTPPDDRAYTIVAESMDRSGMARATLAPRAGMAAEVPRLRRRPLATMKDMGMEMSGASAAGDMASMPGMDHGAVPGTADPHAGMQHPASGGSGSMDMSMRNPKNAPGVRMGPGVQTIAPMPADRTGSPGQGLDDADHRVLTYRDLVALDRNPDVRAPDRSLDIHLTGNMERYMWSFDGVKMSDAREPIPFLEGERVRVTLINDTMMGHPIHLHGHFFELVTGKGGYAPRKHTVVVQPGGKATFDFTASALGDWAFHCHLLLHMHAGMMRIVSVRPRGNAA